MSPRRRIQTDVPETEDPDKSLRDGRPGVGNNSCVFICVMFEHFEHFMMQSETSLVEGITTRCVLVIRSSESE